MFLEQKPGVKGIVYQGVNFYAEKAYPKLLKEAKYKVMGHRPGQGKGSVTGQYGLGFMLAYKYGNSRISAKGTEQYRVALVGPCDGPDFRFHHAFHNIPP
jgi:hypothetical protein